MPARPLIVIIRQRAATCPEIGRVAEAFSSLDRPWKALLTTMPEMNSSSSLPPFSPVLVAGMALRPVPPGLIAPLFKRLLAHIKRNHPEVFSRLEPLGHALFLIDPSDIPFRFLLSLDHGEAEISLLREGEGPEEVDASISGSLLALIELLEGRVDGDALFFSRDLVIEGSTEAVLTLRNAVDSADIHIAEMAMEQLGPLRGPAKLAITRAIALYRRAERDMAVLRKAAVAPLERHMAQQDGALADHEERMERMERDLRKLKAARRTASAKTSVKGY